MGRPRSLHCGRRDVDLVDGARPPPVRYGTSYAGPMIASTRPVAYAGLAVGDGRLPCPSPTRDRVVNGRWGSLLAA